MPDDTQPPAPGFTPTGYQRTQGGSIKWVPPSAEQLGKLLPQYEIESLLGRGGMGAVYRARQKSLDRLVAIKILPPDVVDEEMNFAERFKNEARTMAKMNHPAIVHVYDYGKTTEGQLYIVMEYIDGTDVARMILSQGRLPSQHALAITAHVCDALQYAHKHGVIHRDIKPANILIDMEGAVKVADFGLAKAMDAGQGGLTQTNMAVGTPDYVAPEALMNGIAVDGRADLYAVGVMLYAMLTGNVPRGSFPLPSKTVSTDPRFDQIILKAMEMDREKRYQTAYDIRKDLDVILTTPHVEAGGKSSAAVPKQEVAASAKAQTPPAQKPVAKGPQKRIEGSAGTPARNQITGGGAAKMNEADRNVRAPLPPAKSSLGWIIPTAVSAVVIIGGALLMKGKTVVVTPAGEDEPPIKTAAASPPIKVREESKPVGDDVRSPASKPGTTSAEPTTTAQKSLVTSASTAALAAPKLNVPIPEWLQKARTEGGRLVFHKTVDVPDYFDLGEAAKFDDFVELYSDIYGWLARRSNGEVWGKTAGFDGKVLTFGPVKMRSIHRGDQTIMIDEAGQIQRIYGGKTGPRPSFVPGASMVFGMDGTLHALVAMNAQGSVLGTFGFEAGLSPPPAEFYQNASLVGAGNHVFFAIETGKPVRGWNVITGTTHLSPTIPEVTVEMDITGPTAILLSASGKVSFVNADGMNRSDQVIPSDLGPAIRVRSSPIPSALYAAQKSDGTWVAWGERFPDYRKELFEKAAKLGPLIDLEGGSFEFRIGSYQDKPVKGAYLICIEPRSAPSSTSATPAAIAAAPAHPPASPTPSTPAPASPTLPVSSSPAQPSSALDQRLAALDSGFQAAVERDANSAFKASMAALDKLYLGALDRALAAATQGGKLEEAVALRAEKQRIEKGEGVPSEVDESTATAPVPDTLKTLRKTYRSTTAQHEATKAKAMQPLYDKYDQALAAVQTELTKANQLDDAMRVKSVRDQIAATRGGGEGSAGTPARNQTTGGEAAQMNEADKSVRAPLNTATLLATKDNPFTNSLGMKFVPVPGTDVFFCIHEMRYKDYAAYAAEAPGVDGMWKDQAYDGFTIAERPDDHPVMKVNWDDAQAFCAWLSQKEGKLYRLPTDEEWSYAVGIGREEKRKKDDTPSSLHQKRVPDEYPWGTKLPPPRGAGNYSDQSRKAKAPSNGGSYLDGYDDGFPTTAPAMSFKPNKLGLYDLGGNVWEWCQDWYDGTQKDRVLRGGSWFHYDYITPLSSDRLHYPPVSRKAYYGFRVVLAKSGAAPAATPAPIPATKSATPPPPTPPTPPAAPAPKPATAAKSDFTNSLGMKFVKVPGTKVLFCIHETRKGDYAKYAAETPGVDQTWNKQTQEGLTITERIEEHPVSNVTWNDAQAFCVWLSKKEERTYRLPSDKEWSYAVGIGRNEKWTKDSTPQSLHQMNKTEFPWGGDYPPKTKDQAGNYADTTRKNAFPNALFIEGYTDGFPTSAPVMSFKPNKLGIYDLGGNAWEWIDDWYNKEQKERTLRGGSWFESGIGAEQGYLLSSHRQRSTPDYRYTFYGFRIVLETTDK